MIRALRWSPIPAALLVAAIAGCGCGGDSPDGASTAERLSRPKTAAPERASASEETADKRTVVLHVTGMMKSKSGAT